MRNTKYGTIPRTDPIYVIFHVRLASLMLRDVSTLISSLSDGSEQDFDTFHLKHQIWRAFFTALFQQTVLQSASYASTASCVSLLSQFQFFYFKSANFCSVRKHVYNVHSVH